MHELDLTSTAEGRLVLAALFLFALFVILAVLALTGQTRALDLAISRRLYPPVFAERGSTIRAIHSWGPPGIYLVCALFAFHLARHSRQVDAVALTLCLVGADAQSLIWKGVLRQARPDIYTDFVQLRTFGFPSGHAITSLAVYGMLSLLLTERLPDRRAKLIWRVDALLLALIIGLSRVVGGVHWPSDVLGGLLYGGAWLCVSLVILSRLRRRACWQRQRLAKGREDANPADDC